MSDRSSEPTTTVELQSRAFQPGRRGPEHGPLTLGVLGVVVVWMLLAFAQGTAPASAARYGEAVWPFTLLVLSGLSATFYGFAKRQGWAPGLLTAIAAFDVGFSAHRGELGTFGVLAALAVVVVGFFARAEWRAPST